MLARRPLVIPGLFQRQSRAVCALFIVSSVVKVLDDDDEQRLGRVEVTTASAKSVAVDVGDEAGT